MQEKFYKSKSSSHFPNFEASNAWQMGHNSRQGFILGQELLLDFAAWIDLTSNADNWLAADISCVGSYRTRFASLKHAGDLRVIKALWCLSTTRQATRYLKTMLKILVERAVLHHASLLFALTLDRNSRVVSRHNNLYKKISPDSRCVCNFFK